MEEKKTREGELPRREMVRVGGVAAAALLGGLAVSGVAARSPSAGEGRARRLAMGIDLRKCIGCRACSVACKAEHGVRLGGFRSWVSEREAGAYPAVRKHFLPVLCNHCEKPPCRDVCPTGATHRREDGIVAIDKDKCIGCRHCLGACPYNARYTNPAPDPASEEMFPARTGGTADKCDFCAHRVDNGVTPSCVNTCPVGARIFGDLNDPASEVSRLHASNEPTSLLPQFGTGPAVFYVGGDPRAFETRHGSLDPKDYGEDS
jgi:tetrathionate reductase subunit B